MEANLEMKKKALALLPPVQGQRLGVLEEIPGDILAFLDRL